mgnify:CR=1 FL=1
MEDDKHIERACGLFDQYAALLNQEFYDHDAAGKNASACIGIANQLLQMGFVIFAAVTQSTEIKNPSDDTMRMIFTFIYECVLVPNQVPVPQPIAFASATAKVFGPLTAKEERKNHISISAQDEAWLHAVLDNLGDDKRPLTEERN